MKAKEMDKTIIRQKRSKKSEYDFGIDFNVLLDYHNDGIFILNDQGAFVFISKIVETRSGLPYNQWIGQHFLHNVDPDHHASVRKNVEAILSGKKVEPYEVKYLKPDGKTVFVEINAIPIYEKKKIVGLLGISRNIERRKRIEAELKKLNAELEQRVRRKTANLTKTIIKLENEIENRKRIEKELKASEQKLRKKEKELTASAGNLEEINIALRVLLKKRHEDKADLEEQVLYNVKELVEPYLKKLAQTKLSEKQTALMQIINSHINEITTSFSRGLSLKYMNLTPTEIQIANLIKHGKKSKEIAEYMSVSQRTIDTHRKNIRKKMGLGQKRANLRSHLLAYN
jgi:PAS domain S-box-containing protein